MVVVGDDVVEGFAVVVVVIVVVVVVIVDVVIIFSAESKNPTVTQLLSDQPS